MIANWPGKFLARTSHILWCSNSELLNAQTFKEPLKHHQNGFCISNTQRDKSAVSFNSVWLYQL